jgi:nucleoid-associated protein EbfC
LTNYWFLDLIILVKIILKITKKSIYMFDGIKNTANMLGQANKMKQQQDKLQKMLSGIRVSGISKNGKVTVTVTGDQKIVDVKIDPSLIKFVYENFLNTDDVDTQNKGQSMITTNIMEASNDALSKVQVEMVKKMQEGNGMNDLMDMFKGMQG